MLAIVPAVAVKVLEIAPDATVMDAGTVNKALLLDSAMSAPPAGAVVDNVTVQLDVPLLARPVGLQISELTTACGIKEMTTFFEVLL